LKATIYANDKLELDMTHMDTPYLFYIVSKCEDDLKPKDRSQAICLREQDLHLIDTNKDLFEIDYETYFEKQVIIPLTEFSLISSVAEVLDKYKRSIDPDYDKPKRGRKKKVVEVE
jgi:hypothetical protein